MLVYVGSFREMTDCIRRWINKMGILRCCARLGRTLHEMRYITFIHQLIIDNNITTNVCKRFYDNADNICAKYYQPIYCHRNYTAKLFDRQLFRDSSNYLST